MAYKDRVCEVCTKLVDPNGKPYLRQADLDSFLQRNAKSLSRWCWIIHNKDNYIQQDVDKANKDDPNQTAVVLGQPKDWHLHLALEFENSRSYDAIAKDIGLPNNFVHKPNKKVEAGKKFEAIATYLTHKDEKQQELGKHLYPDSDVHTSGFDYTKLSESYIKYITKKRRQSAKKTTRLVRDGDDVLMGDKRFVGIADKVFHDVLKKDDITDYVNLLEQGEITIDELTEEVGFANYVMNKSAFDRARMNYVRTKYSIGPRYNFYIGPKFGIADGGGIGKTAIARLLAQALFPDLKDVEAYHEVSDLNVPFEGYNYQPCILWNETRSGGMMSILGREKVFDILEPNPGKAQMNVKYGSVILTNQVNIVNGIQNYNDFMRGLAGEYKDRYGQVHESESLNQTYRRFPFVIELTPTALDFYLNNGFFDAEDEYKNYSRACHLGISVRNVMESYEQEALTEVRQKLLTPVVERVDELKEKRKKKKRYVSELTPEDLDFDIQVFNPGEKGAIVLTPYCPQGKDPTEYDPYERFVDEVCKELDSTNPPIGWWTPFLEAEEKADKIGSVYDKLRFKIDESERLYLQEKKNIDLEYVCCVKNNPMASFDCAKKAYQKALREAAKDWLDNGGYDQKMKDYKAALAVVGIVDDDASDDVIEVDSPIVIEDYIE